MMVITFGGDSGGQRVLCYVVEFVASWRLVVFSAQSYGGKGCAVGVGIVIRAAHFQQRTTALN